MSKFSCMNCWVHFLTGFMSSAVVKHGLSYACIHITYNARTAWHKQNIEATKQYKNTLKLFTYVSGNLIFRLNQEWNVHVQSVSECTRGSEKCKSSEHVCVCLHVCEIRNGRNRGRRDRERHIQREWEREISLDITRFKDPQDIHEEGWDLMHL